MQSDLSGKVVLITGSSNGIGRETAIEFAKHKAKLIITYNEDQSAVVKVEELCVAAGAQDIMVHQLNITDNESIRRLVEDVIEHFEHIDILINNAAVIRWAELEDQDFVEIEEQIRTNLEGPIKLTREAIHYVKEMIINIGSGAGKTGYSDLPTYCATKFGIRGFSQAIAADRENIKVYTVNPGMTATRMTGGKGDDPKKVAEIIVNTALGKYDVESGGDVDVWDNI